MKKTNNSLIYFGLISVLIIVAIVIFSKPKTGSYDGFAQCIADSGARMYGTWWCPHCNEQKKDFGASWDIIKENGAYAECANSDRSQTEVCKQAEIRSYPTWRFGDGTEALGRQTFETLSQKTGCVQ